MKRFILKAKAKESMALARPSPLLVTAVYMILSYAVNSVFPVENMTQTLLFKVAPHLFAAPEMDVFTPKSLTAYGLYLLLSLMFTAISAGYAKYSLEVSRNRPTSYSTIFSLIPSFFRYVLLGLASNMIMWIYSLFTVVAAMATAFTMPFAVIIALVVLAFLGIYVQMGFAMSLFVAIDHPELGVFACIKESFAIMRGHRIEYFVLQLSFFPWLLLSFLIIPMLWVNPYMNITFANYYKLISGEGLRPNVIEVEAEVEEEEEPADRWWEE